MNDLILTKNAVPADPLVGQTHHQHRRPASQSPRDLLFVMFWHRGKVMAFFVAALLLTALAVIVMPSTYRSEAKLLDKLGSDTISPDISANLGGAVIQPIIQRDTQMKTELEVLKSNEIALAVVRSLGAGRILHKDAQPITQDESDPVFKQALLALQQNIGLDVVPDSGVLDVTYENGDAKLAQDVCGAYVNAYLASRGDVYSNLRNAAFLQNARETSIAKMDDLQDRIRKIKTEAGVGNVDEQRQILQTRIGVLDADAATARTSRTSAEAEITQINGQLASVPEHVVSTQTHNPAMNWVDDARKENAHMHQELADAKVRFMPQSLQVKVLEQKVAASDEIIAKASTEGESIEGINPAYQELSTRLQTARVDAEVNRQKETAINGELKQANADLEKLNAVGQQVEALTRLSTMQEAKTTIVSAASDRAQLLADLEKQKLNNVVVIQPATLPLKPVAPNRLLLLVLGVFVAASGAVALGIGAEAMSRTTKRPEDIDRLTALPSVSVPVVESHGYMGAANNGALDGGGMLKRLGLFKAGDPKVSVVARAPGTAVTRTGSHTNGQANGSSDLRPVRRWSPQLLQAAHGIIDGLLFDAILSAKGSNTFITGLVSCRPGQGASTLASYVATAIADRLEGSSPALDDEQVLLIDADLTEPTQHRLLSLNESPGLGDWLAVASDADGSIDPFVQRTNHGRLAMMAAGRSGGVTRLLDRMDRLIEQATIDHRHVVIDLPPVSSTPTSLRLAAKCNAVLLVVECGNMHQEVVRRSVIALQQAGAKVAGVVLNKRRFPIPDWLYERAS